MTTFNAHFFRSPDGQVHVVTSTRNRVPRNGAHRAMCAVRVTSDFQRRYFNPMDGQGMSHVSCDGCSRSFVGMVDVLDQAPMNPGANDF